MHANEEQKLQLGVRCYGVPPAPPPRVERRAHTLQFLIAVESCMHASKMEMKVSSTIGMLVLVLPLVRKLTFGLVDHCH